MPLIRDYALDKGRGKDYNVLKGKGGLESLKAKINDHFAKEADLYLIILSADFTDGELEELMRFMQEHPLSKFVEEMKQWKTNQAQKKQQRL